jgi:hypothetical protein
MKNSSFFRKVGKTAILSHFSFSNPVPLPGPPLIRPNFDNCVLLLKSMNEKYFAGVTPATIVPLGATGLDPLSYFVPIMFVALEISKISIYHQFCVWTGVKHVDKERSN